MTDLLTTCPVKTITFGSGFGRLAKHLFHHGTLVSVSVCLLLQASCIFGLNCLLAGRSVALRARTFHRHVMRCVSGTSNSFAFWTQLPFGGAGLMHGPFLTFDRHQVANGHHSEAKIEFAEFLVFLCVVVDDGF